MTRKPSLTNKECVIAANVWNSRKAGTGGPEQSLHKQSEQTNSFQLPGSIEMEPVVPMPTPQPRSSHKLPQVGLETKLSSDPSLKQQGTRDTNGTLKKKIGERVAANRKKSWRQPPRKCLTKHGMELQTQDRSRTCLLPLLNSAWFDACSFTLIAAFSAYVILPLTTEVDFLQIKAISSSKLCSVCSLRLSLFYEWPLMGLSFSWLMIGCGML